MPELTREALERDYDRPSLHCGHPGCTPMGRLCALIDWHREVVHLEVEGLSLTDFTCDLCGFDFRAKLQELYGSEMMPELRETREERNARDRRLADALEIHCTEIDRLLGEYGPLPEEVAAAWAGHQADRRELIAQLRGGIMRLWDDMKERNASN